LQAVKPVWIPAGFTVAYFVVAFLVGPSLDGGLITGTALTFFIAGVFTAALWVVYGFVRLRTAFPVTKVMILTGILGPVVIPAAILGPLWLIGHLLNP
jgi:hypothetical protein